MRAGGEEEAQSLVFYIKDLGNDRFALVDQAMWVSQALKLFPPYDCQPESLHFLGSHYQPAH